MRKTLAAIMTIVTALFLAGLTGCKESVPKADIRDLRSREGKMLVISSTVEGPIDWYDDDRVTGSTIVVSWDGTISKTIHHLSSEEGPQSKVLNDEDYLKFYYFSESAYVNDTFEGYSENDVMDGSTYSFCYYPDGKGNRKILYAGYCYSQKELSDIIDLAYSYFPRASLDEPEQTEPDIEDIKSHSGAMLVITVSNVGKYSPYDDEYSLINFIARWNGELTKTTMSNVDEKKDERTTLSDDDLMTLYTFAVDAYDKNTFASYQEDPGDRNLWRFTYSPPGEDDYQIYYGTVNGNKELTEIANLVSGYFK